MSAILAAFGPLGVVASLPTPVERAVACKEIDDVEKAMVEMPQVPLPLNHMFTPGLYIREVFIPKGTLLTSKIHRTEHPFVISKGVISVWTPDAGVQRYAAPFTGITKPGTRRVLFAHEDVIWSTFHTNPTNEQDVAKIEERIIEPHTEHLGLSSEDLKILKEIQTS